jgi:hypothetical protein
MWITIFNANETKVNKKREGQMLWSTILFADEIGWSSAHAFLSWQRYLFEFCSDRVKVNTYKNFVKYWNTDITPEQIEEYYQSHIKDKKKRTKSKLDLNVVVKGKNLLNALEKSMMDFIDNNERELRINELTPFMNIHCSSRKKENDFIALACYVPFHPTLNKEDTDVALLFFMMTTSFEIPIFSSEIDKLLSYKEFGAKIKKDFFAKGKTNAIRELFLEFASPESLTSSQVLIIRNELNEKFKKVTDVIEEFNKDFGEKKLTVDNLKEINEKYMEKLKPRVSEFQNAIDNNIYMIQLKNKEDNPKIYKLYLVLTTVRNIVGLYEKLNIMNQGSAVYVRDELQQKGVLDALKFFLYLKVEG